MKQNMKQENKMNGNCLKEAPSMARPGKLRTFAVLSIVLTLSYTFTSQADTLGSFSSNIGNIFNKSILYISNDLLDNLQEGFELIVQNIANRFFSTSSQPEDSDLEELADSWAVTEYLISDVESDTVTYYFDNSSYNMVTDPTQIGGGYNKNTESGYSNGTAILKAVMKDSSIYTIMWIDYDDAITEYIVSQHAAASQTEVQETEAEGTT